MTAILPRIRVTRGHTSHWRVTNEISISLTGHCEERLERIEGAEAMVTVYPIGRFKANRRYMWEPHRVAGRRGGRCVIELIIPDWLCS